MGISGVLATECKETKNPPSVQRCYCNQLIYIDMNLIDTHEASCPYCGESISLTLDLSVEEQSYIEDCSVCCQPMAVTYSVKDGELAELIVEVT
jgi:uncharacterized Zn-finger protein